MKKSIVSILCVLSFVAFAAPTVSYQTATNIAKKVIDQKVTKQFVENLGIEAGGGGVDTNAVERIANAAVETNAVTVGLQASVSSLESSKLSKSDVIDPAIATANGQAADAKATGAKLAEKADINGKMTENFSASALTAGAVHVLSRNGLTVGEDSETGTIRLGAFTSIRGDYVIANGQTRGVVDFGDPEAVDYKRSTLTTDGSPVVTSNMMETTVSARISATNPTFSNAVLAVQVSTNDFASLYALKEAFDDMPIDPVTGGISIGALLAALASAAAWLKKNKVGSFSDVGGATATAENGVAKLDDFFTNSNSLLTGTIDDRLPIPISAKSAGFTTESYKRFVVTVSGDMTVTLHTPTSEDAEIFECRFNGASLSADASITFAGATATTMDTDCGTVKAGKVALMSAFWNGTTWDVNWKVEG